MKRRRKRKNFFLDDDHISFLFTLKWEEHLKSILLFNFLLDDNSSIDDQEKIDILYSFGVKIDELDEENLEKIEILRDLHYEILFDEPVKN